MSTQTTCSKRALTHSWDRDGMEVSMSINERFRVGTLDISLHGIRLHCASADYCFNDNVAQVSFGAHTGDLDILCQGATEALNSLASRFGWGLTGVEVVEAEDLSPFAGEFTDGYLDPAAEKADSQLRLFNADPACHHRSQGKRLPALAERGMPT